MLVEFNVKNYKSLKDLNTLSMVSVKSFKEHLETNTITVNEKDRLLKTAALYGNNASGKSNLLESIRFMKQMVLHSFRNSLNEPNDQAFFIDKFSLNKKSLEEPSYFEITFILDQTKYRYGFELDYGKVLREWLYYTVSKEVRLFERLGQELSINKSAYAEAVGKESNLKENVLFLTLNAQLNGELSTKVVGWFYQMNNITGLHDNGYSNYTTEKLKEDKSFHRWVSYFLKYLEISNISIKEEETETSDSNIKKAKKLLLETYHRLYDENNVFIETTPFILDFQESEGTKKILYLLGPLFDTLRTGKVLCIDELDSRLHPNITRSIIDFFHEFNKRNAQLIFATHDVSILTSKVFRRDQIWFVEKDQFGASQLASLADFKSARVRPNSAFDKNYLDGNYGAIPYFHVDEDLIQTLYGEEGT